MIRLLVTGLSQRGTEIDPRSVHVRCVVKKVAIGRVVPPFFSFRPSVSFHQRSTLIVIYMLLLPDGQMNESWEPSNNRLAMDRGAVSVNV